MQKEIYELTKEELINPEFIPSVFKEYPNKDERDEVLAMLIAQSKELEVYDKVKHAIDINNKKVVNNFNVQALLLVNAKGEPEPTTGNYVSIFNKDEKLKKAFFYDEFEKKVKYCDPNGNVRTWNDDDESKLKVYVEETYGIYHAQKFYDAFRAVATSRKVHPLKDIIEKGDWDGLPRIDKFLVDVMGCEDDDYTREVSRMIFYGGINRLYSPGCKFDYMPILIGKQSAGKSTIINWLALDDKYYKDLTSIEGKDGMEALDNAWICEMGELLAMVRAKEVEMLKAYISRTNDKYRKSYARYSSDNPRHCIFIGSTNDTTFLMDKTGNRRYLPIKVASDGKKLYSKKQKIKEYIMQCWREALYLMRQNNTYLTIPEEYLDLVEKHQADAVMEDPRVGLILAYLDKRKIGDKVSAIELFTKCLNGLRKNYNIQEGKEISRIMDMLKDWDRCDRFWDKDFGQQRGWVKIEPKTISYRKSPIYDDELEDLD